MTDAENYWPPQGSSAQPELGDEICGMSEVTDLPITLMSLWLRNREGTRPIGEIISDARAGLLPDVEPLESGFGFRVVDEAAALSAMRAS